MSEECPNEEDDNVSEPILTTMCAHAVCVYDTHTQRPMDTLVDELNIQSHS